MLHGRHIDLETDDEFSVLMDYAIHNVFRDGKNAVDRMLEENPPAEGSMERRLLRSMQKSHYTIFKVRTPIAGLGVRGLDGPERREILVVDLSFAATAVPGTALATRLHSPGEGWWMTTGAALPITQAARTRIISEISRHECRFAAEPAEQERTTMIMRACVASGASRRIRYAAMGQSVVPPTIERDSRSSRVGRNEPCPCGSGKKFKKCCG